jgi:hypothetical protein
VENKFKVYHIEVGNGIGIRFWHDSWCEGVILKDAFPDLFCIAQAKEASGGSYMLEQ